MSSIFSGFWGLLALVILAAIVFVQAGRLGGANGGEQTANILKAAGGSGSQLITAIETGGANGNA